MEALISITDAARLLSVNHLTLRIWIKEGRAPVEFFKIAGSAWRCRKSDLEAYLAGSQ